MTVFKNYFRRLFSQCSHLSLLFCPGTRKVKIRLGTSTGISGVGKNFITASDLFPVQNRFVNRAWKTLPSLVQHQFCFLLSCPFHTNSVQQINFLHWGESGTAMGTDAREADGARVDLEQWQLSNLLVSTWDCNFPVFHSRRQVQA